MWNLSKHAPEAPLTFVQKIERNVATHPFSPAIRSQEISLDYDQLWLEVNRLRKILAKLSVPQIALQAVNSAAWVVIDLAALKEGITLIPVPHFFTGQQVEHLLRDSKTDMLVCDHSGGKKIPDTFTATAIDNKDQLEILGARFSVYLGDCHGSEPGDDQGAKISKISYTSGTTGDPKGVLISRKSINNTVHSLAQIIGEDAAASHLCTLPFSLLLENVAGIYAVLACGGCCTIPSFSELGFNGSSSLDMEKFVSLVETIQPTSMITVPAILQGMTGYGKQLDRSIQSFEFVAVGGAPVSARVLNDARQLGIPVFEGYGLTECGSVVTLNRPGDDLPGSVGKPLPHCSVSIDDCDEITISGVDFLGYTTGTSQGNPAHYRTGDLGYFDEQGFLHITGRKSSIFSTAFGRNVSPEWVESEINAEPLIAQSAVYGEGQESNIAIITPSSPQIDDLQLDAAISNVNSRLPDYARISRWIRTAQPFSVANGEASGIGTIRRENIHANYFPAIESITHSQKVTVNELI